MVCRGHRYSTLLIMNKSNFLGIFFKLINCIIFPTMSILLIKAVNVLSQYQVFFIQVAIGTIISFFALMLMRVPFQKLKDTRDYLLYLARAASNLIAINLWIYSLLNLGINEATAISYSGPLWIILIARFFFKEKLSPNILILLAFNIVGMFIIINPKLNDVNILSAISALGAIIFWSIYEVICKIQTSNQHYLQQTFYFMLTSSILLLPLVAMDWETIPINIYPHLFLASALAVVNITVIFLAYSFAPMILLAPFSYMRLIFTAILSFIFFGQTFQIELFIGSAIILTANLLFIFKKNNSCEK